MAKPKKDQRYNKAGNIVITDKEKLRTKIIIGKNKSHTNKVVSESKATLRRIGVRLRNADIKFNINMEYVKNGAREEFEIIN